MAGPLSPERMTPGYRPDNLAHVAALGLLLLLILAGGYFVQRRLPRYSRGVLWVGLPSSVLGLDQLFADEPAGFRMLAFIAVTLLILKVIVVVNERVIGMPALPLGRWLGFATAWVGMQPRPLAVPTRSRLDGGVSLVRRGALYVLLGGVLISCARASTERVPSFERTVLLVVALSLVIHFGLCTILAGVWRLLGSDVDPPFRAPLRAESLREFWAKRWNTAFSEMTAIAVYRPLLGRVGHGPALLLGFMWSGLLHEMAISLPARAGFGLPTLYFILHGLLVALERRLARAGHCLAGWVGRGWTLVWLVLPLPLLLPKPFLVGVLWPLLGSVGYTP
jgi:hypothetical protein